MLFGVVTDQHGAAIAGAKVEVVARDGGPLHSSPVVYQTVTRADGQYTLYVFPGTYMVRFASASHSVVWLREYLLMTLDRFDAQIDLSRAPGVVSLFDGTQREKWINPAVPYCEWSCPSVDSPRPEWWLTEPCPPGTTLQLRATDDEQTAGCELPGGVRHGAYTRWVTGRSDGKRASEESGWYVNGKLCPRHDGSASRATSATYSHALATW